MAVAADRVRGALWGLYIGDALAMPSHWYYGGPSQVQREYGVIKGYVAPVSRLSGSIMNLSNTGGAGRGSDSGEVIGNVIMHGKKQFWLRSAGGYHYHQGMQAGDNTLEALLTRVITTSMTEKGVYDADDIRQRYIDFMTTPGTHNDTYAGTCHRIFFSNFSQGIDPKQCAGNDGHNVDTMDALVNLIPVILAAHLSGKPDSLRRDIAHQVAMCRRSQPAVDSGMIFADSLNRLLATRENPSAALEAIAEPYGMTAATVARRQDPLTA